MMMMMMTTATGSAVSAPVCSRRPTSRNDLGEWSGTAPIKLTSEKKLVSGKTCLVVTATNCAGKTIEALEL
jgi:hypothetical protein